MRTSQPKYHGLLIGLFCLVVSTIAFTNYLGRHRRSSRPIPPEIFVNTDPRFEQEAIEPDFDVMAFTRALDTLWTEIEREPIQVTCSLSRTECNGQRRRAYQFNPGKGHMILRVSFQITEFANPADQKVEMNRLKEKGSQSFGLTYAYDNLWVTSTKLFWFGAGCTYAGFNYERMVAAVRNAIHEEGLRPFLDCDCGFGCESLP